MFWGRWINLYPEIQAPSGTIILIQIMTLMTESQVNIEVNLPEQYGVNQLSNATGS